MHQQAVFGLRCGQGHHCGCSCKRIFSTIASRVRFHFTSWHHSGQKMKNESEELRIANQIRMLIIWTDEYHLNDFRQLLGYMLHVNLPSSNHFDVLPPSCKLNTRSRIRGGLPSNLKCKLYHKVEIACQCSARSCFVEGS